VPPSASCNTTFTAAPDLAAALADANIYREPTTYGYPVIAASSSPKYPPKFGDLFVEQRLTGQKRPKLVDGLDWAPSSAANASTRVLQDGETELCSAQ